MGPPKTRQSNTQAARNPVSLVIAALAALLGGYFAVEPLFDVPLLIHPGASILVFLFCAPLILGFYGHSVGESVVTGILVPAGFGVHLSDPAFPPVRRLAGAVITAGYALPVPVCTFVIGAALGGDGTVRTDKQRIALAVVVSLLCAGLVTAGISARILTPGGDQ